MQWEFTYLTSANDKEVTTNRTKVIEKLEKIKTGEAMTNEKGTNASSGKMCSACHNSDTGKPNEGGKNFCDSR